jgi:hypothetical protein
MAGKFLCRGCGGAVRNSLVDLCGFCREERGEKVVFDRPPPLNSARDQRLNTALMRTDEFQKNWGLV